MTNIQKFNLKDWKSLAREQREKYVWVMQVEMTSPIYYPRPAPGVEFPPEWQKLKSLYSLIECMTDEQLEKEAVAVRSEYLERKRALQLQNTAAYRETGKKIFEAKKKLAFGGQIEFTHFDQLRGYNEARGNWNEFECAKVNRCIARLNRTFPGFGKYPEPKWTSKDDYITLKVDYCNEHDVKQYEAWAKEAKAMVEVETKADSVRWEIEKNEYAPGQFAYTFEFIMWWD